LSFSVDVARYRHQFYERDRYNVGRFKMVGKEEREEGGREELSD
jgi:hypothetical protein